MFKVVSKSIQKSSKCFDIDSSQNNKMSAIDVLIRDSVLGKCLESDELMYVEG